MGKNSSKSHKNRCPCLSLKWVPKSTLKFDFREIWQKCIFSTLVWPSLNEGQNSSKSHRNRCPCLSLKWLPKSTFQMQFWEIWQKCIFSTLVWTTWMRSKITPNFIKTSIHAYFSNAHLNPLSNFNFEKVDKSASFQPLYDQPGTSAKWLQIS